MIIKYLDSKKGLTLIELLAAIALISIIMLPLTLTVNSGLRSFFIEDEEIEIMQNGRVALDRIVDRIREADEVNVENKYGMTHLVVDDKRYYLKDNELIEEIDGIGNTIALFVDEFNMFPDYEMIGNRNVLKSVDLELKLIGPKYNRVFSVKTSIYIRGR